MNVTADDIKAAKQAQKTILAKAVLLNRGFYAVGQITGRIVSGSVSIGSDSFFRRSARLTLEAGDINAEALTDRFIKLYCGLCGSDGERVRWYSEGVFIVSGASIAADSGKRLLTLTLGDLMAELNGERGGALSGYGFIAKGGEKITRVVENVLDIAGVKMRELCEIKLMRETDGIFDESDTDDLIPYDMRFSAGASAYDIIKKCVGLYPYYEAGFDADGVFFVRVKPLEGDSSFAAADAASLTGLVIAEETGIKYSGVKNVVEVWGKNGEYHGEAAEHTPDNPFNAASFRELRLVVSGSENGVDAENICDRYKDDELAAQLMSQKLETEAQIYTLTMLDSPTPEEQARLSQLKAGLSEINARQKANISVSGDSLAEQWAKRLLYERSRPAETLKLKTVLLPFFGDAGFKISYRPRSDGRLRVYTVKEVTHDLREGVTTLSCERFYCEQYAAYAEALDAPVITAFAARYMTLTVSFTAVPGAQSYMLYIDSRPAAKGAGTNITVTLPESFAGEHRINVTARADAVRESPYSAPERVTLEAVPSESLLITEDGDLIATENGENIKTTEEGS